MSPRVRKSPLARAIQRAATSMTRRAFKTGAKVAGAAASQAVARTVAEAWERCGGVGGLGNNAAGHIAAARRPARGGGKGPPFPPLCDTGWAPRRGGASAGDFARGR